MANSPGSTQISFMPIELTDASSAARQAEGNPATNTMQKAARITRFLPGALQPPTTESRVRLDAPRPSLHITQNLGASRRTLRDIRVADLVS